MTAPSRCEAFSCFERAASATCFCLKHQFRLSPADQDALSRARGVHFSERDPLKREITLVQMNNVIGNCRDALATGERRIG
jgi:hypothetical protein